MDLGCPGKIAAIGILLAIVSLGALAKERVATLAPGTLRIGTYFVNPPFEYVSKGARVGFEVDLMNEVAHRLGLAPVFVNTQWEAILREMEQGRYDCIVGGITITPNRERILAWSTPYMTTTLSLVVNRAKSPGIRDIADLKNASIGVQAATTDYDAAIMMQKQGEIGGVKVYPFDRIEEAMADLEVGKITAVMKVAPVAAWLAAKRPNLRIVAQVPNDPQPLGIGFGEKNSGMVTAMNQVIVTMQQDGSLKRLKEKWNVP
ncbi:MAG: amino acid ABC transporter substrate-binding protein [Verrucomicrobia bacterium]|nr:amino acid ABC transporter substrate-binding protein [Verrucomicrobiota bacterium]